MIDTDIPGIDEATKKPGVPNVSIRYMNRDRIGEGLKLKSGLVFTTFTTFFTNSIL